MNIENFLRENVDRGDVEQKVKIGVFEDPFIIVPISEDENESIRRTATKTRLSKSGNRVEDTDSTKYLENLVLRCVKFPDFNNATLQKSYGTEGDAAATMKRMLLPGEYADLAKAVQEANGFETVDELAEDVKK